MKKKSISKNSLGPEVFSHKKIFFLRPVLSPLRRREPKELFPKKTLKMVLNDASQKAMFVWDKTFFFTSMKKVRVSFSVFFFFCENHSYKDFLGQRKFHHGNRQKKVVFEKAFRILKGKNTSFGSVGNWVKITLALPLSAIFIPKTSSKKTSISLNEIFFWFINHGRSKTGNEENSRILPLFWAKENYCYWGKARRGTDGNSQKSER